MSGARIGAHRGTMAYDPENTLLAFRRAIEYGTYRIELDVHLSKDGHVVVMHDDEVDRTTNGTGYVWDKTLQELKELDAGRGEHIPTLQEVFDVVKGKTKLLVEIKQEGMEEKVVRLIEENGMEEDVIVSSFIEAALERIKKLNPRIRTAAFQLEDAPLNVKELVDRLGIQMIVGNWRTLTAEEVKEAHRHGILMRVGLSDRLDSGETEKAVREMNKIGVDEISSGRPDLIGRILESEGS